MVTTKTVSVIFDLALRLNAIADFLYENGMREESDLLRSASVNSSKVSHSIQDKLIRYSHEAMKEDDT